MIKQNACVCEVSVSRITSRGLSKSGKSRSREKIDAVLSVMVATKSEMAIPEMSQISLIHEHSEVFSSKCSVHLMDQINQGRTRFAVRCVAICHAVCGFCDGAQMHRDSQRETDLQLGNAQQVNYNVVCPEKN